MKNPTGYIHSIESAGTLEGPGIRRVLFLSGCPLRCLYCHNPDTQKLKYGRFTDAFSELREIAKNRDMLIKMKGGVTLSGGEPLMQPQLVKAIFDGCKRMGLHTALDTSGFLNENADNELLALTDLVLLDIKSFDATEYKKLTGNRLQPTLDFAKRLSEMNKPVWLRYVLVPGYTDNMSAIGELALFAQSLGNVERVEVLPFHKMGEYKWKELGLTYRLYDTPEPDEETVEEARYLFKKAGLNTY
ncbi:MAG: pyruvate formate lyase-activating protein [Balneolaceae bacterium]|nr:MAG: pyruvate formate lyase-activating protein [Balneolaceae bacterium]